MDALIEAYRFYVDAISTTKMECHNERCDKIIKNELVRRQ